MVARMFVVIAMVIVVMMMVMSMMMPVVSGIIVVIACTHWHQVHSAERTFAGFVFYHLWVHRARIFFHDRLKIKDC
nr:hypothetical protein [uncultured Dysgonomonas sp.]